MNKRLRKHLLTAIAFGVSWTIGGYIFNDYLNYSGIVGGCVVFLLNVISDKWSNKNQD